MGNRPESLAEVYWDVKCFSAMGFDANMSD